MNSTMPSPSPLVPQGSIPPKNTSRSTRVLVIGLTVVGFHVAGLSLVLLQGCQKDGATTAGAETNNAASSTALTLPPVETNPTPYYTSASNLPAAAPQTSNLAANPNPTPAYTPGT